MVGKPVVALLLLAPELDRSATEYLARHGHETRSACEPWEADRLIAGGGIDVAVVGPHSDAIDLLRTGAGEGGPLFLVLTSEADVLGKVLPLELGAADVVDAAVPMRELAARITGLLLRRGHPARELLVLENATIDLKAALVMHRSGAEELLSPGQVALLRLFISRPRTVLTRDDIIAHAPAEDADAFDRSIDSRIVRLRRRLDTQSIVTVRGAGYRFDPPGEPATA